MKQKELVINPSLGFEAEKMITEYFAVQIVSDIKGFVLSEEDFLNNY